MATLQGLHHSTNVPDSDRALHDMRIAVPSRSAGRNENAVASADALIAVVNVIALLAPYVAGVFPARAPEYVDDFCTKRKAGQAEVAVRQGQ